MSPFVQLDKVLPPVIESIRTDWITSCQSAAVVSALFASIAAQLLSTMGLTGDSSSGVTNAAALKALMVFAYSSLLLSCSATISSLILIDEFGELPMHAARTKDAPRREDTVGASTSELLEMFGARPKWKWVMYHWLVCLVAGICCMVMQIILYVWLTEGLAVKIVLLLVTVFTVLPLLFLIPARRRHSFSAPHSPSSPGGP
ncbi:hypothetical protein EVG20_g2401 [Dentipellis fragilis]|uniref:Transmembrane protein n=1 Tax=Dentipellis fragilis TaxID=205917 RepID=A0A4Y9Z784_9AGAM|nr:hypothetical protein EVG20_g2401 [Dentipellis fragilis]